MYICTYMYIHQHTKNSRFSISLSLYIYIICIIQNTHVQIAIVQLANRTNLNRAAYTSACTPAATPATTGNVTPRVLFSLLTVSFFSVLICTHTHAHHRRANWRSRCRRRPGRQPVQPRPQRQDADRESRFQHQFSEQLQGSNGQRSWYPFGQRRYCIDYRRQAAPRKIIHD